MAIIYNICMSIVLLYVFFFAASSQRYCNNKKKKIVIDTDAGGDDALAIMLALMYSTKNRNVDIVGITCTYGNTNLENVIQNVLKILTVANRYYLPVYGGAQRPLESTYSPDIFFGNDGFGDFNFTQPIITSFLNEMNATEFLVNLVKQYPGEITIISIAPLTNIALAILLEPRFLHYVKQHIIMGARVNTTQMFKTEFNFEQDPESNWIVLNSTKKPSTVLAIDSIYDNTITKVEYEELFNTFNESIANFLKQAERLSYNVTPTWEPADAVTMAIALQPDIITRSFAANLQPIINGIERGSVSIDYDTEYNNAKIVQNYNITKFKMLLTQTLS